MNPFKPLPPALINNNVYRSPIYVQEIKHRQGTQTRDIQGI
jgi:hypothetical protein